MDTTTRPIRLHLAMKDGPIPRAIKQVLPAIGNDNLHVYTEEMKEADLIIFSNPREIEHGYDKEKSYVYLKVHAGHVPQLPKNCKTIDSTNILVGLIVLIRETHEKLGPVSEVATPPADEVVPLRHDALRILVIDDTPKNIASAKSDLAGHRLTTVTGYEDAMSVLSTEKFDIVLCDLHLPMSSKTMGDKFKLGELVPYGILLMVEAAKQGAKSVAVVTDLSHHDDPFSAAFDHFSRYSVQIDGAKVVMMHASMKNNTKDWAAALERLMKT